MRSMRQVVRFKYQFDETSTLTHCTRAINEFEDFFKLLINREFVSWRMQLYTYKTIDGTVEKKQLV